MNDIASLNSWTEDALRDKHDCVAHQTFMAWSVCSRPPGVDRVCLLMEDWQDIIRWTKTHLGLACHIAYYTSMVAAIALDVVIEINFPELFIFQLMARPVC